MALNSTPPPWSPEIIERFVSIMDQIEKICKAQQERRLAGVVGEKTVRVPARPGKQERIRL
jgi:hypothetical protein